MKQFLTLVILTGLLMTPVSSVYAENHYDNINALKDITTPKVYFDVSLDDDQKLLLRLSLLDRTLRQLKESGLDASVVIGFRGGASRFITKDDHYVLEEELTNKKKIGEWIRQFTTQGAVIEQCAIAAELFDIPASDFLSEIEIVANGYVSLIGYQTQGYAVVPMD